MSERCHVCGPVKHEAPTVICAPCALIPPEGKPYGAGILGRLVEGWRRRREIWAAACQAMNIPRDGR